MRSEKLPSGKTRITRGDGSSFEYRSACSPTAEELEFARCPYDEGERMQEVVEDTCRTLLTGGYFYPEGFRWLRDNWGVSFVDGKLTLHPAVFDFAREAVGVN